MKTSTIERLLQLAKETNNIHTQNIIGILEIEKQRKANKQALKNKKDLSDYQCGYLDALKHAERLKNAKKSNLPYPCNVFHSAAKTAIELSEIKREILDKANRQNKVFEEMKANLEKINVNIKENVNFAKENRIVEENKNYKEAEEKYINAVEEIPIGKLSIECIIDYIKKRVRIRR